jgi:MFS family permease
VISGSWVPRLPTFKDHLHLTNGQIGLALLVYAVGAIVGAGLARVAIGRGSRIWVRVGTVALCVALVPVGFAGNLAELVVAFLMLGTFAGFIDVLENAQAAELERTARRPLINGFHGFWSLGALIGSVAAGAAAYVGVPPLQHFAVVAVLVAIVSGPLLGSLPDTRGGSTPAEASSSRKVLTRSAAIVTAIAFCGIIVEGGGGDWSALYLREYGASPGLAAAGFAGFAVAMTAVRFGADRLTALTSTTIVARVGALLAAAGLTIAIAIPAVTGASIGFVLAGAGVAVMVPLAFSAGANLGRSATALSIVTAAAYAGSIAGPALIGNVADRVGLRAAMGIPLAAALIIVILAGSLKTEKARASGPYSLQ